MIGVFFVILACGIWALDTLIRYPLLGSGVSPFTIVFIEHLILSAIFLPIVLERRKKFWDAKVSHLFYMVMVGAFGSALGTLAFTKAFTLINPSLVILLQKLQPIIAIVLARAVLREKIQKKFLGWAAVCLVGGFFISYRDLYPGITQLDLDSGLLNNKALLGYGLTLVAVIGWGSATVFGKKLSSIGYSEREIMGGRFISAFATLGLLAFFMGGVKVAVGEMVWGKIALMVFLSGILAMYFYYHGLKKISARLCTLAEMFFPFFAVVVNWIFLDATLDVTQIFGAVLLLLGSSVIELKHY